MAMRNPVTVLLLLVLGAILPETAFAHPRDYAVEVQAAVRESPPTIELSWTPDPGAQIYYVYRKQLPDTTFGDPLAVLSGTATGFTDADVEVGRSYEYSLRKTVSVVRDTVLVTPGSALTFTIEDSWGDGICCANGLGSYSVSGCGVTYASGGAFGFSESTSFVAESGTGEPCAEVVVGIILDVFGEETTWRLTDDGSGQTLASGGPYSAPRFGHILAGIRSPAPEDTGTVLLIVQAEIAPYLDAELDRLEWDLIREGRRVLRRQVSEVDEVPAVKQLILAEHDADHSISTLFLIGHVPVPYSGDVRGAHPDHWGAWPADLYYGDLDGVWTDSLVSNTSASRPENHNVPGDGKFDQTYLPSPVDLEVGRVDLSRMTAFTTLDHVGLLQRYLGKDHAWRTGQVEAEPRGLIDDNVGDAYGTAYAACGWRNFTAMFGADQVFAGDFFPALETESYLFSYGCGPSGYTQCGGVASTADFVARNVKTVFTMLMGSYFGDWDNENNVLRAPLGSQGHTLTSCWSGRPTWILHSMALGRSIGASARETQNNHFLYTISYGGRQIHTALMGDPTLKMWVVRPPSGLSADTLPEGQVRLSWSPSPDPVLGYHVYRAPGVRSSFRRINLVEVQDTTFTDEHPLSGNNVYLVRGVKLESNTSGSFLNLSPGTIDSTSVTSSIEPPPPGLGIDLDASPFTKEMTFRCRLSRSARMSLSIFDVRGALVRRLADGDFPVGVHPIRWDGRDDRERPLGAGIYCYLLRAEGRSVAGRVCLLR